MSETTAELMSFFETSELGTDCFAQYANLVFQSAKSHEAFADLLREYEQRVARGEGDALHAGVGYLILGRFQQAGQWLAKADDSRYRHYWAAQAATAHHAFDEAIAAYKKAAAAGWDPFEIDMRCAELHLRSGDATAATKLVKVHERDGADRADWYYVRGLLVEQAGDRAAAIDLYEKALALDPDHVPTMFRAAWLYDLRGDDDKAIELYKRLALQPRAHVNALMNLAVIYEDIGRYDDAITCLQRVLVAYPNHTRARLFLKDVESSRKMVIDDAIEKRVESRNRLLATPISEFELSVRARNCLKKMNIQTLGDLLKLTEQELLAYKNFGETSLEEINQLLAKRGLRLGQRPEDIDPAALVPAPPEPPRVTVPPGTEALLSKPVFELELSVRARRCLQRLNIETVGELIQRTEAELLAARNFGVTSLNEIKTRLKELGLSLAPKS